MSLPQTHWAAIISQPYIHNATNIVCCGRDKSRPYSGGGLAVGLWQCRSLFQRRTRETRGHAPLSHVAAIISQPYNVNVLF